MTLTHVPLETLVQIRGNLLKGLDLIAEHIEAGTLHDSPGEHQCPPIAGGHLTLSLLEVFDDEIGRREQA